MNSTQTFVLRLFVTPEGQMTLKGMLHHVREDADYPFHCEEELVLLLYQLATQGSGKNVSGEKLSPGPKEQGEGRKGKP